MKRRDFIKNISAGGAATAILGGIPVSTFGQLNPLRELATLGNNDRVMVIIQLHGGNDGLNTLIPMDQYAQYYNLRSNVAIPEKGHRRFLPLDSTLADNQQMGVHPDFTAFKDLYDRGIASVVQSVSYPNNNGSHFRGRDIWFMGGDYDDYYSTGWAGRYLQEMFDSYPEGYPNERMPDPPGLEIGNGVSLVYHSGQELPTAISVNNPRQFYDLVDQTIREKNESPFYDIPDNFYGKELDWLLNIEEKADVYSTRLQEVFQAGRNSRHVIYPERYPLLAPDGALRNPLSIQLKLIARLLAGGSKTKIFLVRIGGFDTHAQQVEAYDSTMGIHSALLYHVSTAMRSFQEDLRGLGLEDRVLSFTFSEFGRRGFSNGSFGTDHGTGAPLFLFGKYVKPGIIGHNPDLTNLERGNIPMQYDYRQVLKSLLKDWMEAPTEAINASIPDAGLLDDLELVDMEKAITSSDFISERYILEDCFPNPVRKMAYFSYRINIEGWVELAISDTNGKKVARLVSKRQQAGEYKVEADLSHLAKGTYLYRLRCGKFDASKKFVKL